MDADQRSKLVSNLFERIGKLENTQGFCAEKIVDKGEILIRFTTEESFRVSSKLKGLMFFIFADEHGMTHVRETTHITSKDMSDEFTQITGIRSENFAVDDERQLAA